MNEEQLNNIRNDIICDTAILISYKTYKEDNADFENSQLYKNFAKNGLD